MRLLKPVPLLTALAVFQPALLPAQERIQLPPKEQFHLYLLVGQSNMAGWGTVAAEDQQPDGRVLTLTKDGRWIPAVDPIHYDKPIAGVGLGKTFGIEVAKAKPGITVGLIPAAVGGSPIDTWKPGVFYEPTKSYPWDDAIRRAHIALKAGTLKGILWHQGESDSTPQLAPTYQGKLRDLIARFRKELDAEDVPFIIGQLGVFSDAPWSEDRKTVDRVHRELPGAISRTYFVGAEGLRHQGDKTHFDAASYREFGMRFAKVYLNAERLDIDAGRDLFLKNCSACHGDTGKGGRAPDLTSGEWRHGASDEDILRNITKGIPATQMPAIPLRDADAKKVVAFLRSVTSGTAREPITGDAENGRRLFFGSSRCAECHMFGGRGGILGPELTDVRGRRRVRDLTREIAAPVKYVEARSKNGATVRGVDKGEDTFTIRLMDDRSRWHVLSKRDVTVTSTETPHPALNNKDRDDVIAFLLKSPVVYDPPAEWTPSPDFNVTFARLKNPEPHNWLTYWGDLNGRHFSALKQITPANVSSLKSKWTFQLGGDTVETTPLVVDGMMFVTGPLNDATALDARTGQPLWKYTRRLPQVASHCTVMTNRGFAVLGDRLYMATLDMHLVALDAQSGNVVFDIEVDDYKKGFSITHAPLAIDGKIIVGVTSGECALTGFVDAYDAKSGKRLWRTHSIPQPGDPNRKTWMPEKSADYGGSPTWTTGTYDIDTNTLYWMTGNPGPDYDGRVRGGDNLYSCSVLALDPETGRMKWWFQFTPHDVHDWDGNQTPVLIDGVVRGKKRKLLITAQRNAFYYVLDRETGEFITGQAFAKQTWAKGLDDKGRPIVLPNTTPTPDGNYVCPDAAGAANWGSPSFDPSTNFLIVSVREACATYTSITKSPVPGEGYTGGGQEIDRKIGTPGSVRALDALTGARRWDFALHVGSSATGVVATSGGVVFASSNDGNLVALDSRTGKYLWHYYTGANIIASPMSYAVDGKQYVAIASQSAIFVFGLP